MPRKAAVGYETIFETLKKMTVFSENGELKKKKDPVWKEACAIMKDINTHNLYLMVYQDRKNLKTNLMKYLNIKPPPPSSDKKLKKRKLYKKTKKERAYEKWDDFDFYESLDANNQDDGNKEVVLSDLNTLLSMMNSTEFNHVIHKIGVLPFCVNYWHPQQVNLWNNLMKTHSTVSLIVLNHLIKDITEDFDSGNIYLYALAFQKGNVTILLTQAMISSTKSLEIQHFLSLWLQSVNSTLQEIAVGYSYSLLNAVSMAFNNCSFDTYNIRCFQNLMNEELDLPSTLIHIDLMTLIKVVDGWTCFHNILQAVKDLYLCSIMHLSTLDNLEEFKEVVISVLTLCQSPFQSEGTETRRAILWNYLTTEGIQEMNQQYIQYVTGKNGSIVYSYFNENYEIRTNNSPHEIYDYINQLKLQAFELCDFSMDSEKIPNSYYCPVILDNLIQLLVEFPSWTKIITMKNDCSTLVSLCSIKHLNALTEIKEPINPPQFLVYHIEKIEKMITIGKNIVNSRKNNDHFYVVQTDNDIPQLVPSTSNEDFAELNELSTEMNTDENDELNLLDFKNTIRSTMHSLVNFDKCVEHMLDVQLQPGQESLVTKCLIDCCAEMKIYESLFGMVAARFCSSSDIFSSTFKQIFEDCYYTIELLENIELKNIAKLFAHLLQTNSISWEILSVCKLNQRDISVAQKMFIRVIFRELSEHMGMVKLLEKLQNKDFKSVFNGLLPMDNPRDAKNAANFYKSIGLDEIANLLNKTIKAGVPTSNIKSFASGSKITPVDDDFVIEVRVSKPPTTQKVTDVKKKIVVVKKPTNAS